MLLGRFAWSGRLVLECILFVSWHLSRRVTSSEISHSHDGAPDTSSVLAGPEESHGARGWEKCGALIMTQISAAMNSFPVFSSQRFSRTIDVLL